MSNHPPSSSLHPHRILVRGVNWLGDAVMTTPALLRLREKFPEAHIALLTPEKLGGLWLRHPAVDEAIPFTSGEDVFSIGRRLRERQFDLALVLPNSPRSALDVWLAGIPIRIGYARPWRNWFLTTRVPPRPDAVKMRKRSVGEIKSLIASGVETQNWKFKTPNGSQHQIHEYLHLASVLGASSEPLPPQLFVEPEEIEIAQKKFFLSEAAHPIFGLNPGAEYGPAKRWPIERFVAAADEIRKQTHCTWLIFGAKGDADLATRIHSALGTAHPAINLAGQTSLRELMALFKVCRVVLTNDTGPMHAAAALGTPVVVPFGSTSPELTGPGLSGDLRHHLLKSDAPCSPCFLRECPIDFRCMTGISIERVVDAVVAAAR